MAVWELYTFKEGTLSLEEVIAMLRLGNLSNEDGNANNDGSEKSHCWIGTLLLYMCGFCLLRLEFC